MDKIKFDVWRITDDMCRITAHDIRTDIRKLSDGAVICDITTLLDEMTSIIEKTAVIGYKVVFDVIDGRIK